MSQWTTLFAVAGGGAIGAALRHGLQLATLKIFGPSFPLGTFGANVLGCFAMGLLVSFLAGREPHPPELRAFLAVGLLGGFTTFSAFALDALTLWRERAAAAAIVYILASVSLSLGGLIAGVAAGRTLW
jgi:CrcB protein